jgi:hypothetical protein
MAGRRYARSMAAELTPHRPGFAEIDIDISRVPSVEQGIADAAERYKGFTALARDAVRLHDEMLLFESHIALLSFINRAVSLHAGIVSAVKESNPHAAFTLLRAYLELIVVVRWVDLHPDYIEALKRPMASLPKNTRKRWDELFEDAAEEMAGIRHVYAVLSEMAHFGSTALWHPFTVEDEADRRMSYRTGPHWKRADDARVALAMLREADEVVMLVLERYRDHHVVPPVARHLTLDRVARKLAAESGNTAPRSHDEIEGGWTIVSAELAGDAMADGLAAVCEVHGVVEIAADVTPEQLEEWVDNWVGRRAECKPADIGSATT